MSNERRLKRVTIYEEFVELCKALKCKSTTAPLVLSQTWYWTKVANDMDNDVWKKIESYERMGDELTVMEIKEKQLKDGWFWKSAQELSDDIMVGVSRSTVERTLTEFEEAGLLQRRQSKKKIRNTNELKLNIPLLRYLLNRLGYTLMDYPVWSEDTPVQVSQKTDKLITDYLEKLRIQEEEKLKKEAEKKARKEAKKEAKKSYPQVAHDEQLNISVTHDEQLNDSVTHDEQLNISVTHGEQLNSGSVAHGEQPISEITSLTDITLRDSENTIYTDTTFEEEEQENFSVNHFAFQEFKNYFTENYPHLYDESMYTQIYEQMEIQKLDMFTTKEAVDQAKRMMKKGSQNIIDYASYFVGGIIKNRPSKSFVLNQRKQEQAVTKKKQPQATNNIPFYDWLNQ